ncbi:hypothetical protein SAMN04488696_1013 [Methanolobus profundi]|uniref:Uncharacterized protein n=1 Tax=Methanolobus profundi TaxID=487685 RepID=A0A1I4PZQ8_9EURY|nr:hypothetical protein SAMN04488696_1013 [Methanolobus profundi]
MFILFILLFSTVVLPIAISQAASDPYGTRTDKGIDFSNTNVDENIIEVLSSIKNSFLPIVFFLILLVGIVIAKRKRNQGVKEQVEHVETASTSSDATPRTSVVNNYYYGDNINTHVADSVIQHSFNQNHESQSESAQLSNSSVKADEQIETNNRTKTDDKLDYSKVYRYLVDIASHACTNKWIEFENIDYKNYRKQLCEKKIIVTYGDVLERFGKPRNDIKNLQELSEILDEINNNTHPLLLSALVVNGNDFIPSKPFFEKWMGLFDSTMEECVEAFKKELQSIWNHYCTEEHDNINDKVESPNSNDFASELHSELESAESEGKAYLDVKSGDLHRTVGSYPSPHHRMHTCCNVMRQMMNEDDEILEQPPKGNGANLVIRYHLPRK